MKQSLVGRLRYLNDLAYMSGHSALIHNDEPVNRHPYDRQPDKAAQYCNDSLKTQCGRLWARLPYVSR